MTPEPGDRCWENEDVSTALLCSKGKNGKQWLKLKNLSVCLDSKATPYSPRNYLAREMFFCQTAPKSDLMKRGLQERSAGDPGRGRGDSAVRPPERRSQGRGGPGRCGPGPGASRICGVSYRRRGLGCFQPKRLCFADWCM